YSPLFPRALPPFPTRRSSDLLLVADVVHVQAHGGVGQVVPGDEGVEHGVAVLAHVEAAGLGVPHAALPAPADAPGQLIEARGVRSEEHTSELQSRENLVCRLL